MLKKKYLSAQSLLFCCLGVFFDEFSKHGVKNRTLKWVKLTLKWTLSLSFPFLFPSLSKREAFTKSQPRTDHRNHFGSLARHKILFWQIANEI